MNNVYTAYYDLLAMAGLLNMKNNKKLTAVHVYPLLRDLCLMIYQINREILSDSIDLDPNIKKIRHRVKLFEKKNNYKVYERIVNLHTHQFGSEVDNLGFYLEGDKLIGSTLYPTYIYKDTQFFSTHPKETKANVFAFAKIIGQTITVVIEKLNEKSNYTLPNFEIPSIDFEDETAYRDKDILNTRFYCEAQNQNVVLTRLLLSLQEVSTCIWLYNGISSDSNTLKIDNYILLRLLSIKTDEVMDNLRNMRKFLTEPFHEVDEKCEYKLSEILNEFDSDLKYECRKLRNMIHYKEHKENFFDYVANELTKDSNYIKGLTQRLIYYYMLPLNNVISEYLQINRINSMNIAEKVFRRISSLVKGGDFRSH